ncbi:hypothetical protein DAX92_05230 [Salmonella enterica subsp. enterica]|uniref:Uncharacterized protein n=1 Tax=Salmonella enterica I TaxID=59201 RepID=A0A7Z1QF84_SALET|nr:hypothetical protein [Salmonella enterica]PUF41227.1 hypothetical protein DAX92_05230 [Salmonella enterica subsp. enterica]PUF62798.1 hypothetical protein DAX73_05655 [Salmonella enterica subsp. enterica]
MVFIARAAAPIFSALAGATRTIVTRILLLFLTNLQEISWYLSAYYASRIYKTLTNVTEKVFLIQ